MKNRYPGTCCDCGTSVPAQSGECLKEDGVWLVFCEGCAPEQSKPAPVARELTGDGRVITPYEPENLTLLRSFPGARWVKGNKCWKVSTDDADLPRVIEIAQTLGLKIDPDLLARAETKTEQAVIAAQDERLFPYQVIGVDRLSRQERFLLGDEMGLGKTIQVCVAIRGRDWPVMVVCPNSLKYNWANEIGVWAPEYRTSILSGRKGMRWPEPGEVVIINYDILSELEDAPKELLVVFDEAQYFKNAGKRGTTRAKRSKKLSAQATRVWALTGTPLMNRPMDLWGVLSVIGIERTVFGGWKTFLKLFGAYKNQWGGLEFHKPTTEVPERLRRACLRRLRKDVLPDLPDKMFQTIEVNHLNGKLIAKLDSLMDEFMDCGELPPFTMFSEIRAELAESRVPAVLEIVSSYEENEEPLLVFSAHRAPIDALDEREGWATITGDTPIEHRQEIVEQFQGGQLKGVGLTIAAGGTGLTLTRASHLLFVDLDWTPALNAQAEDRACRIGQTAKKVLVKRMVSPHPLDLHIHNLLAQKTAMSYAAIDAHASAVVPAPKPVPEKPKRKSVSAPKGPSKEFIRAAHDAVKILADVCDRAESQDGQGFNKYDAKFGHELAYLDTLTPRQALAAAKMVRKYQRQLPANIKAILWP